MVNFIAIDGYLRKSREFCWKVTKPSAIRLRRDITSSLSYLCSDLRRVANSNHFLPPAPLSFMCFVLCALHAFIIVPLPLPDHKNEFFLVFNHTRLSFSTTNKWGTNFHNDTCKLFGCNHEHCTLANKFRLLT